MNKLLLCIILLVFTPFERVCAQNSSTLIFNKSSLEELFVESSNQNKIIFLDVAATWCGPCKSMEKHVFTNDSVANYYNTNFISAKFDIDRGEGKKIEATYSIVSVPTFLFLNHKGEVLHKHIGGLNAKDFLFLGETAMNQDLRNAHFKNQYDKDRTNHEALALYASKLKQEGLSTDTLVSHYLENIPSNDLLKKVNLELITNYIYEDSTSYFTFILQHLDTVKTILGEAFTNDYIFTIYTTKINQALNKKRPSPTAFLYYADKLKAFTISDAQHKKANFLNILFYTIIKDEANYIENCIQLMNNNSVTSRELYHYANSFFTKYSTSKTEMDYAEKWAAKSIELDKNARNTLLYAKILYTLKKYDEAKIQAEQSISISNGADFSNSSALNLLKKINKKLD